jgi:hypothetical protein
MACQKKIKNATRHVLKSLGGSVGDPDPHVFGPSRSNSQRSGSGSFPFLIKTEYKVLAGNFYKKKI